MARSAVLLLVFYSSYFVSFFFNDTRSGWVLLSVGLFLFAILIAHFFGFAYSPYASSLPPFLPSFYSFQIELTPHSHSLLTKGTNGTGFPHPKRQTGNISLSIRTKEGINALI